MYCPAMLPMPGIRVVTIFDMRVLIMSFNMWKIVGNLYNFPFCIVRLLKISFVRYYHDFILMIFNCNLSINITFHIHTTISVHGIILSHCMYMQLTFLPSIHLFIHTIWNWKWTLCSEWMLFGINTKQNKTATETETT